MSEQLLHQILHKLDHIKSEQQSMKSDIQSMKSDILDLRETQELMRAQLQETDEIVRVILDRQGEIDAKLDALSLDVHKLQGELASIKLNGDRLEKIVEQLAARSFEQESQIRDIRLAK